jgi:hypothetical protein
MLHMVLPLPSAYSPGPSHASHELDPPKDAFPGSQSEQDASSVAVQEVASNSPKPQTLHVEQPDFST